MRSFVITGASGLLGKSLISAMQNTELRYRIIAVTRHVRGLQQWADANSVHLDQIASLDDILRRRIGLPVDSCVIHCAFARGASSHALVESIGIVRDMLEFSSEQKAAKFINMSSQSVYGKGSRPPWGENSKRAPRDLYGMAKVASEELCFAYSSRNDMRVASVRLASLVENAGFLRVWVRSGLRNMEVEVHKGGQRFSFLDSRDAALGVLALARTSADQWQSVYNLGSGTQQTMTEIEQAFVDIFKEMQGSCPDFIVKRVESDIDVQMDITRLQKLTGFSPRFSFRDSLRRLWIGMRDQSSGISEIP